MITLQPHPSFYPKVFLCRFPKSVGEFTDAELLSVRHYFQDNVVAPIPKVDTKQKIRDMLRHGGFGPSGRNKPAHEYLSKAIEKGWFSPQRGINAAVDVCNVISLHSGLPISVVDFDRLKPPLTLQLCPKDCTYPFNPSGQILKAGGLLALWDQDGPSATPVKDSQRSKTSDKSRKTLTIVWGHQDLKSHTEAALEWHQSLLRSLGCELEDVPIIQSGS